MEACVDPETARWVVKGILAVGAVVVMIIGVLRL